MNKSPENRNPENAPNRRSGKALKRVGASLLVAAVATTGVVVTKASTENAHERDRKAGIAKLDRHLTHAYSEVSVEGVGLLEPLKLNNGRVVDLVAVDMNTEKNQETQESPGIPYSYDGLYVQMEGQDGSKAAGVVEMINTETETAAIVLSREKLEARGDSETARLFLVTRGVSESADPSRTEFIQNRIGLTYVQSVQIQGNNGTVTSVNAFNENIPPQVVNQDGLINGTLIPAETP